jgi:hypothetical protein
VDVVGVAAPDVEDGQATWSAGFAQEGEDGHLEALAGGRAGLVGVQVAGVVEGEAVGDPGPAVVAGQQGDPPRDLDERLEDSTAGLSRGASST